MGLARRILEAIGEAELHPSRGLEPKYPKSPEKGASYHDVAAALGAAGWEIHDAHVDSEGEKDAYVTSWFHPSTGGTVSISVGELGEYHPATDGWVGSDEVDVIMVNDSKQSYEITNSVGSVKAHAANLLQKHGEPAGLTEPVYALDAENHGALAKWPWLVTSSVNIGDPISKYNPLTVLVGDPDDNDTVGFPDSADVKYLLDALHLSYFWNSAKYARGFAVYPGINQTPDKFNDDVRWLVVELKNNLAKGQG